MSSLTKPLAKLVKKEKSERILTFDLLRGYFLTVILLNHLNYYPSGFDIFTGRSILYVSTAEGFFLVSGIVLGIVRGRKLINQPFKVAAKLLWTRAAQLYITSIILTFLFTLVGQLFIGDPGLKYGIFTNWSNGWELVWKTLTLNYTYGWADFLRLYAIFIFFAPFALWLLRKNLWPVIVAVSVGVWSLLPLIDDTMTSRPMAWQLVFFSGFIIGYYWPNIVEWWRGLSLILRKSVGWSMVGLSAITLGITVFLVFGHYFGGALGSQIDSIHHIVEQYFNKDRLPLARLAMGALWFWSLFFVFRRFEGWITKRLGWLLLNFGTNSLYVYTISAFVVFFMHLLITPSVDGNLIINFFLSSLVIGIVWLAVKTKFLMNIIPR